MKKAYMIILSLLIALGSSAFAGTNYIGRLVFSDGLNEGMKSGTNYTDSISRLLRNDLQTDTYFQRISFGEFSQVQGKEGLGELGEVHVVVHGDGVTVFSTEQDGSLKGGLYYLTTSNDVYDVCNLKLTDGTIVPFNKGRIETVCFCEATHTWAAGDVFAGSASSYSKNDQIFVSTDGINWEVHNTNIPKSAFYTAGWRGFSCDENGRWILGRYDAAGQGASNFEPLFYSTDNLKTFKYDKDIPAFYASARGRRGFTGYTTVFDEVVRVWFDSKGNINHKFLTKAEIRPRSGTNFSVTGASACNGAIIFTSRGVGSRFVIYEDIDRFEEFIEKGFTLGGVNSIDGYFYCTKRNGSEILMTVDGHSFEVAGDIGLGTSGKTRMLCRVGNKVYAGDKKLRVADVFASSNAHSWLRDDAGTLTNSASFKKAVEEVESDPTVKITNGVIDVRGTTLRPLTTSPVQSVNSKTGAVILDGTEIKIGYSDIYYPEDYDHRDTIADALGAVDASLSYCYSNLTDNIRALTEIMNEDFAQKSEVVSNENGSAENLSITGTSKVEHGTLTVQRNNLYVGDKPIGSLFDEKADLNALKKYVNITYRINDHSFQEGESINLTASDVGAYSIAQANQAFVPWQRKINNQTLGADITLDEMPVTGLVWNASLKRVNTFDGRTIIGAEEVGAVSTNEFALKLALKRGAEDLSYKYIYDEYLPIKTDYGAAESYDWSSYYFIKSSTVDDSYELKSADGKTGAIFSSDGKYKAGDKLIFGRKPISQLYGVTVAAFDDSLMLTSFTNSSSFKMVIETTAKNLIKEKIDSLDASTATASNIVDVLKSIYAE